MLKHFSRRTAVAAWFGTLAIIGSATAIGGVSATPATWALLLFIGLVPPALSLVIWQAPPQTVHEVLYVARQARPRS